MTAKHIPASIIWFLLTLAAIVVVTMLGPAESSLGTNVRVVYLHGTWVWTALVAFVSAGIVGLAGLILNKETIQHWSQALGYTGLLFWISYLPISMWAMQSNWNGLYLAEPRFRLAVIFSISGLLLQMGLALLNKPTWTSLANLAFAAILMFALRNTSNVMHPPAPILESDSWRIQIFFLGLLALTLLAAWHTVRWFYQINGPGKRALEVEG